LFRISSHNVHDLFSDKGRHNNDHRPQAQNEKPDDLPGFVSYFE